ncbi:MAG TPA: hypothetical protein VGJ82_20490, partial [Thermoanaerobaculia bacterium]
MNRILPNWATELRQRYLRGEASIFILHGNVYDAVLSDGRVVTLSEFLGQVLLEQSKQTIAVYNVATGVRFIKREAGLCVDEALLSQDKPRILMALEKMLTDGADSAVILEYAEAISPAGDSNFQSEGDRAAIVTLHRWSFLEGIEKSDNVVILIAENLTELAPKLVANPKIAVVEVPMPDEGERQAAVRIANKELDEKQVAQYAEITAGLKTIQIISILTPAPATDQDPGDRDGFLRIAQRKREILERECFDLVEFVQPEHGFEVVGGMDEVKKDL